MHSTPKLKRRLLSFPCTVVHEENLTTTEQPIAGTPKVMKMTSPPQPKRCLTMLNDLIKRTSSLLPTSQSVSARSEISMDQDCPSASRQDTKRRVLLDSFAAENTLPQPIFRAPPNLQEMPNLSNFAREVAEKRKSQAEHFDQQERQLHEMQDTLAGIVTKQSAFSAKRRQIARNMSQLCDETLPSLKAQMTTLSEEILQLLGQEKALRYQVATDSGPSVDERRYRSLMETHVAEVTEAEKDPEHDELRAKIMAKVRENEEATASVRQEISTHKEKTFCPDENTASRLVAEKQRVLTIESRKRISLQQETETVLGLEVEMRALKKSGAAQNQRLKMRCSQAKLHLQQLEEESFALQAEINDLRKELCL